MCMSQGVISGLYHNLLVFLRGIRRDCHERVCQDGNEDHADVSLVKESVLNLACTHTTRKWQMIKKRTIRPRASQLYVGQLLEVSAPLLRRKGIDSHIPSGRCEAHDNLENLVSHLARIAVRIR
jgi:hypothetical protein